MAKAHSKSFAMANARTMVVAVVALLAVALSSQSSWAASTTSPPAPTPSSRPPMVTLIEQQFPSARGWFRLVSGLTYQQGPKGFSPNWETITHPKVLRQDAAGHRLMPTLPLRADGAVEVAIDGRPEFWVRATPLDVRPVPGLLADGIVAYPGAYPGADLLYKVTPTHVDEYLYVAAPEKRRTLRIRLETGPAVRSMRVRDSVLELLDAQGNAWLRARPPFARDLAGIKRDGSLGLEGNLLTLTLDLEGLSFPVLIDPDWTTTGRMVWERFANDTYVLPSGQVLAPAGCTLVVCPAGIGMPACSVVLNRAEIYQPSSGTWRNVTGLAEARFGYAGASLPDGRVLVAGGCTTPRCTAMTGQTEIFDPATETWDAGVPLSGPNAWATATPLPGGDILVAGGCSPTGCLATTAVYQSATGTWRAGPAMRTPRGLHSATTLTDGRVLVAGGCSTISCESVLSSTEVYDPQSDSWSAAGELSSPRSGHTATRMAGGDVLVAGGCALASCRPTLMTAERWQVGLKSWRAVAPMASPRHHHTAALLSDGKVLVAGGCVDVGNCTRLSEVYDSTRNSWTADSQLSVNRGYQSSSVLNDGRLLIAGGCNENTCLPWAETYQTLIVPSDGGMDAGPADAGPPDAGPNGADSGSSGSDAGSSAPDASVTEPPKPKPCGCTTGPDGSGWMVLMVAAGLMWTLRPFRRRLG